MTVSPEINIPNLPGVAPTPQTPNSGPVEIFQAELLAIFKQLASGEGLSSLGEGDAQDDPSTPDEEESTASASDPALMTTAWVDVRPQLIRMPEMKQTFAFDLVGKVDSSADAKSDGALEPTVTKGQPDVKLETLPMPTPGKPVPAAKQNEDQLAFTAELLPRLQAKTGDETTAENATKLAEQGPLRFETKPNGNKEPAPADSNSGQSKGSDQKASGERVSGTKASAAENQAKASDAKQDEPAPAPKAVSAKESGKDERAAQAARHVQRVAEIPMADKSRAQDHSATAGQAITHDVKTSQPSAAGDHKAEPTATLKSASSVVEPTPVRQESVVALRSIREVSLGLTSEQTRVGIQFRESESGTLQVSVRTPDAALSASLQRGLDELAANLTKQGIETQVWTGSEGQRLNVNASEQSSDPGQQGLKDGQGGGGNAGGDANHHKHQSRSQPEWLDALGVETDSEATKEVYEWPLTSQIFRAR